MWKNIDKHCLIFVLRYISCSDSSATGRGSLGFETPTLDGDFPSSINGLGVSLKATRMPACESSSTMLGISMPPKAASESFTTIPCLSTAGFEGAKIDCCFTKSDEVGGTGIPRTSFNNSSSVSVKGGIAVRFEVSCPTEMEEPKSVTMRMQTHLQEHAWFLSDGGRCRRDARQFVFVRLDSVLNPMPRNHEN